MNSTAQAKQKISESAQAAKTAAADTAADAAQAAQSYAQDKTNQAKDGVASEMHTTADALRRAANEVREGSPQGSAFSFMADGLADMADSVKDQSVNDMVGNVTSFARSNPVAFLGGAALIGFAATRFAKASTPPAAPYVGSRASAPVNPGFSGSMERDYD